MIDVHFVLSSSLDTYLKQIHQDFTLPKDSSISTGSFVLSVCNSVGISSGTTLESAAVDMEVTYY
jgi:hypothetical protein